jgi:excisionase family DNA binding protein
MLRVLHLFRLLQEAVKEMSAEYLPIRVTANRFGVSAATIYRYISAGKIRAVRVGARQMIEVATVRQWFSDAPEVRKILEQREPVEATA